MNINIILIFQQAKLSSYKLLDDVTWKKVVVDELIRSFIKELSRLPTTQDLRRNKMDADGV